MNREKRRYPRVQVNRPSHIRVANGPESNAQLIDISVGGASLFYPEPVTDGTEVELRFHLDIGTQIKCLIYGEVRHYYARGESHVIGVEFTHFAPDAEETVREFVRLKLETGE